MTSIVTNNSDNIIDMLSLVRTLNIDDDGHGNETPYETMRSTGRLLGPDRYAEGGVETLTTEEEKRLLVKYLFRTLTHQQHGDRQNEPPLESRLRNNTTPTETLLLRLSQDLERELVILDDELEKSREFLKIVNGKLCDVNPCFVKEMKFLRPSDLGSARVGDFNENLSYAMLDHRGIQKLFANRDDDRGVDIEQSRTRIHDFERTLVNAVGGDGDGVGGGIEYQGSFMRTEETNPQPAHVDFSWEFLQKEGAKNVYIAFFPLTEDGMFIQVWEDDAEAADNTQRRVYGNLVFVPHGKLLILPANTVHAGGFKSCDHGNLRFHLYFAVEDSALPRFQKNTYTEKGDKRKELCDRFKNAPCIEQTAKLLFD